MSVEKIIVISTYPPKGKTYAHKHSAVASYTKNTLVNAKRSDENLDFLVLADFLEDSENEYDDAKVKVRRCWEKGNPFVFVPIFLQIAKEKSYKKVFLALEWSLFGAKRWPLAFLPLFLIFLKLLGKKVYVVSHAVLVNGEEISAQMGWKMESLKTKIMTFMLRVYYWSILNFSHQVVAFEQELANQIVKLFGKGEKITVIPHGSAAPENNYSYRQARKKLGVSDDTIYVVCFGFLVWYKGSDWLVENMFSYLKAHPKSKIRLVMAGGESQVYQNDQNYKRWASTIYMIAEKSKGKVKVTGFLPQEDIPLYYAAADMIVLPYRLFVSSSGPLSIAFSYKRPVVFSKPLSKYKFTSDFADALKSSGLKMGDISFDMDPESLGEKLSQVVKDESLQGKMVEFVRCMDRVRDFKLIGERYAKWLRN